MRYLLFVAWACCAFSSLVGAADEKSDVEKLLAHSILPPALAMSEVQDYTEARVPKMPENLTAEQWHAQAKQMRADVLNKVVFRGEAANWRTAQTRVEWLDALLCPGYRIRKLRYEALPGLWIPALLYEPQRMSGKVPAFLNVNGHDGVGKSAKYKQIRCINLAKRGMLVLNVEWLGMGQLRQEGFQHNRMNQLDLCGASGLAPFYLAMQKGLDILLSHESTDGARIGVSGLSGGGWQTIVISSLDERVTLANPVAGYSSFRTRARNLSDLGDSEQTPCDLATVADYSHLTAMLAPRGLLLTYNLKDNCCFASGHALQPLLDAAAPKFALYEGKPRLRSHVNHDPGTHNFERDNREALYRAIGDWFYEGSAGYQAEEMNVDEEVKTTDELNVPLPEKNHDFNTLALELIKSLPREPELPTSKTRAQAWQKQRRARLAEVVKAKDYQVAAQEAGQETQGDTQATYWRLRIGDAWTVPAVELTRGQAKGTTLLVAESGKQSMAPEAERLLKEGQRVVAVDPFYWGESKIQQRDYLFALLVSAVGERPLGLQASQLVAVVHWLNQARKLVPVQVVAHGSRASLAALVAGGLEPLTIGRIELHDCFGSLKQVIEESRGVNQAPELFTFGLLEEFDIKQLAALHAPQPVQLIRPSDRAKTELSALSNWYKLLGKTHNVVE